MESNQNTAERRSIIPPPSVNSRNRYQDRQSNYLQGQSYKRNRTDDASSSKDEPKRAKIEPPRRDRIVNNDLTDLHVAITTSNGADLSKRELKSIQENIEKQQADYNYENSDGNFIAFEDRAKIDKGVLKYVCRNRLSKEWLVSKITTLDSDALGLKLVLQKELPSKTKCEIYIPSNSIPRSKLKKILQNMNPNLGVHNWTFDFDSSSKYESGFKFIAWIPSELMSVIMENGIEYGFGKVKPTVLNEQDEHIPAAGPSPIIMDLDPAKPSAESLTALKMDFCNIRGLRTNLNVVHQHLEIKQPTLFFLTETKISSPVDAANLQYPGYKLEHNFLSNAGVCMYYREDICFRRLHDLEDKLLSSIWARVDHGGHPRIYGCIYRPHIGCLETIRLFQHLQSSTDKILKQIPSAELVIFGDFNAHHKEWLGSWKTNFAGKRLYKFALDNRFSQLVRSKTRIPEIEYHRSSTLDLLLTSHPDDYVVVVEAPLGTSDHCIVRTSLNFALPSLDRSASEQCKIDHCDSAKFGTIDHEPCTNLLGFSSAIDQRYRDADEEYKEEQQESVQNKQRNSNRNFGQERQESHQDATEERQMLDNTRDFDDFTAFLRYTRDQDKLQDYVNKKCVLAKKAIGTKITEQHLVLELIGSLAEVRIKRDLLLNTPKTLKDLRIAIRNYNYCHICDKIGHVPKFCWTSRKQNGDNVLGS